MKGKQIFDMTLGLEKPWSIKKVEMIKLKVETYGQIYIHPYFEKENLSISGVKHSII